MIKKLQRRFIRIALAVLTAAILLAAVTINLANLVALRGEIASEAETLLTEGHGQNRRNGGNGHGRKPREADFEARYFLVTTEAGDLTADLSHVSSYTQETALQETTIYVFTPKGDLYRLPAGATLLDFAYHIHSGVGNTCVGGIVNG